MSTPVVSRNNRQELLISSLEKFFIGRPVSEVEPGVTTRETRELLDILENRLGISLRVIDWFVTNYAKKNHTTYFLEIPSVDRVTGEASTIKKQFIVHIEYKLQLRGYSKESFDPFCRRDRIAFYYNRQDFIVTTVGQLNFFRWAINNNIIGYIRDHFSEIEQDMNQCYKASYSREKSVRSSKSSRSGKTSSTFTASLGSMDDGYNINKQEIMTGNMSGDSSSSSSGSNEAIDMEGDEVRLRRRRHELCESATKKLNTHKVQVKLYF